jgi:hypothetical protein
MLLPLEGSPVKFPIGFGKCIEHQLGFEGTLKE